MFGEKSLKTNMMAGQWSQNVSEESSLSPNYTMKLCFMKLKSCIKFDHVVRPKTLCHETFWSLMKHNFG